MDRNLKEAIQAAAAASKAQDWAQAAASWQAVIDVHGDRAPASAYAYLTSAHIKRGEVERADVAIRQGLDRYPDDLALMTAYAAMAGTAQDWGQAAARWQAVIEVHGDRAPARAYAHLASAHINRGEVERASAAIRQGLDRYPDDLALMTAHATAATRARDWAQAATRWQAVVDIHGDKAPASAHPEGPTPDEIAVNLLGPAATAHLVGTIDEGGGNCGIYVYEARQRPRSGRGVETVRFVEKNIIKPRIEYELARHLYEKSVFPFGCPDFAVLFPTVYGVARRHGAQKIYMEYLDRMGRPASLDAQLAGNLAKAICKLHFYLSSIPDSLKDSGPVGISLNETGWNNIGVINTLKGRMAIDVLQLQEILSRVNDMPAVLMHNDIHWDNFEAKYTDNGYSIKFIDCHPIRHNVVGSDLYFFASVSLEGENGNEFFRSLTQAYATEVGCPAHEIRLTAHMSTISQLLNQRHLPDYPDRTHADEVVSEIVLLCEKARQEWMIGCR